jgi:acetyl-CoA carboxylase biotin carboxyl carrier protein
MNIDFDQIRELMRALEEFDIRELELESEGERIVLRRGGEVAGAPAYAVGPPTLVPPPPAASPSHHAPAAVEAAADDPSIAYVTSPFVGTFYASPSPDAPPFVQVGQRFERGASLCIIEAMKLMNEIEAEFAGTLVEVLAKNGKPVEYGERLFKVRKA